jgi:peptidoglycan/LPS O-acetylase OafA/YrhL
MGLLRVALAMAVVLGHLPLASYKFVNAAVAVQSFYIISGFYMVLVLDGKYRDTRLFYSNRLLRLAPTYFVMMAIAAGALWGLNASATGSAEIIERAFRDPTSALVMAFENVFVIGQEMLFWFTIEADGTLAFAPNGALPDETTTLAWQALLVPQAWSLSMELFFYALAPFFARMSWQWLAAIALASLGLRFGGVLLPVDFPLWQGRLFPTGLFLFLLGMLAHRTLPLAARAPKAVGWVMGLAVLAMVALMPLSDLPPVAQRFITFGAIAIATPFMFATFKDDAFDRWVGEISYPLYLCHLVVIGIVLTYEPPFALWIAIGGSVAMAIALQVLIEQPVDRWRQRRAARKGSPPRDAVPTPA